MYTVKCKIEGTAALLQNRFAGNNTQEASGSSGTPDYSGEWIEKAYLMNGREIIQPAMHIKAGLANAAKDFKMQGKRGRSYKDFLKAVVFVQPEILLHNKTLPENMKLRVNQYSDEVYIDQRPVRVGRARVLRSRLALAPGWILNFKLEVVNDEMPFNTLKTILEQAGLISGIGDYRPEFGRFKVLECEKM